MIYVPFCTFELAYPLPYFGGNPLAGRAEIFSARKIKKMTCVLAYFVFFAVPLQRIWKRLIMRIKRI